MGRSGWSWRLDNAFCGVGMTRLRSSLQTSEQRAYAAPEKIPSELMARLTVGGRMLIPVGKTVQYLKLVTRKPDDGFDIQTLYQVRFVPLQ